MTCPHCGKPLQLTIQRGDYAQAHNLLEEAEELINHLSDSPTKTQLRNKVESAKKIVGAEIAIGVSKV